MSKHNDTSAADVIQQQTNHQMFLANNLALDLGNRITGYRERTDISDHFISVGVCKALAATLVASSTSEEKAIESLLFLIEGTTLVVRQGWADRMAAEAAKKGGAA